MDSYEKHIRELKKRITYSVLTLVVATVAVFLKSSEILQLFRDDLGFELYAFQPFEVFYTQLMLSILLGVLISVPVVLYQVLKFMRPGLKEHEYKTMRNYLPLSTMLFLGGSAFAYQFIVKTSLEFFQNLNQASTIGALWGLSNTMGYAIKISAYTGVFFQVPIVSAVLARAGVLDSAMMKKYRSHFIVVLLIAAAIATPPDVLTQLLLTLPVIALYQGSIYLVKKINC